MRASWILVVAFAFISLPACARKQEQRAEQASSQEPGYGSEQGWESEGAQGRGPEAPRVPTDEPRARGEGAETDEYAPLYSEDEAARQQRGAEACPVHVEGAEVSSRDVPNGVALVFTTDGDVEELRTRVDRYSQLYNERSAAREAGSPHEAPQGTVESRADVEEIDRGAQLILTPRDPDQLSALRQEAQRSAQEMSGGECPMQGQAGG